ncbi:MAG: WYL domain-containing protein [Desulfovibrionaceae bacterium]|nr:WYL domain-containing protein [Desulfovibrionaceae bacterium]
MPNKNSDATAGQKLLEMFRKLMLDGRNHFQSDLAGEFQCSPQTIGRMAAEIESVIGLSLESGLENRRRFYRIRSLNRRMLPLEYEELRYLSICRDLAGHLLPGDVAKRVDNTLLNLSVLMADSEYANREKVQKGQVSFFRKGHIDYTPHQAVIERLLLAIEEKRVCLVHYKASGKVEAREHRVVPSSLVSQSNALYLLGALVTPQNEFKSYINLAVHRIQEVDLTDKTSEIPQPPADLGAFGLPWHEPRKLRIQFQAGKAADYVRERIWSVEQKIEDLPDGGIVLEILSQSDEELMSFVRSFGRNAKLL